MYTLHKPLMIQNDIPLIRVVLLLVFTLLHIASHSKLGGLRSLAFQKTSGTRLVKTRNFQFL